jgi:hypothetical protein
MADLPRERHTAAEIRDEVSRLLNARRSAPLPVPLPTRLSMPSDPFTDFGANWQMPEQSAWRLHQDDVRRAIVAVKAKWDLV